MTPTMTFKMSSQGKSLTVETVNVAFLKLMKTQCLKADEMTGTWNNRKLASVIYLAGAEGDGSLWAVSKTMKYSPAPEWTGRYISPTQQIKVQAPQVFGTSVQFLIRSTHRSFGVIFWLSCWISLGPKSSHLFSCGLFPTHSPAFIFPLWTMGTREKNKLLHQLKPFPGSLESSAGEYKLLQPFSVCLGIFNVLWNLFCTMVSKG